MTYPTNAAELLKSDFAGADDFFLLAKMENTKEAYVLNIAPDMPIAVNKQNIVDEIYERQGIALPTRKEINTGNGIMSSSVNDADVRLIGLGAFLWLSENGADEKMFSLERDNGAPVDAGCWTQPSGLCSDSPLETMLRELNEEAGILVVENGKVDRLAFTLPNQFAFSGGDKVLQSTLGHRSEQVDNVSREFSRISSLLGGKSLEHKNTILHTELKETAGSERLTINMPDGKSIEMTGIICDDVEQRSFMLHVPIVANYWGDGKIFAVDPEPFGRKGAMFAESELAEIKKVPALADYVQKLNR